MPDAASSPFNTSAKALSCLSRAASPLLSEMRVAGGAPSRASSTMREDAPLLACSIKTCCAAVAECGKKAAMSARICVRARTAMAKMTISSHSPRAARLTSIAAVFNDRHLGSIAIGILGIDRPNTIAVAAKFDPFDDMGEVAVPRNELQVTRPPRAAETRRIDPLERRQIACQGCTNAFDEPAEGIRATLA